MRLFFLAIEPLKPNQTEGISRDPRYPRQERGRPSRVMGRFLFGGQVLLYPPKTNMTAERPLFEDVFPIEHGGCSNVTLVFRGVNFPVIPGIIQS